jgi:hypothetical protein
VVLLAGMLDASTSSSRADEPMLVIPLAVHVTRVGDAGDEARIAVFREAYRPHGICFAVRREPLPEARWHLRDIRARHALRARLVPRRFNVFLVDRADDPRPSASTVRAAARAGFVPGGELSGAHVPATGHRPATFAFVTRRGSGLSIAHEVGHFLGAGHSADPTNLMSYAPERHRFDARQVRVFRARAARAIRRGDVTRGEPCDPT